MAAELTDRFGGLTAYTHSPASGFWQSEGGHAERDDIIVLEVMTESVDASWWRDYRGMLEKRFAQDEVVIRALGIQRL